MEQQITIARPAPEVFAYLADPAHLRDWLTHLRRDDTELPEGGLESDRSAGTVRWSFDPAGEWRVQEVDGVTRLILHLQRDTAPAADPTGPETPEDAARFSAEAALQSLKSHLERAGGGDPDLRTADVSSRAYGHSATQDPDI
ncbi:SRPBCC family protein [Sabulicella glaciei]|uniref:SRPBCC family protein n=1 Tax=Sabulicella glaciei TaxID=2984948 RepID=A0ABT3NVD0_9PROT|nr:SRPBCC family protein [Roseococcus sp. MDT2-1-1]MCW8086104.1 SRPBCC family protein [Roseococcus sp. MDT2-1-1]